MYSNVLSAWALLLWLASSSSAWAAPLNLKNAVDYALRHSPNIDSAQRNALISTLERKNALAAFFPTLDLDSSHGITRTHPISDPEIWTSKFSVNLAQTLYDNGQNFTRYKTANLLEQEQAIQLLQIRDKLILDIAREFYQYALATKVLEIQQEQYNLLQKQYELVEGSYKQGLKTRKDYLRFKTQVNRADIDLVNAKNTVTKSKQELMRLLGVPLDSNENFSFLPDESIPKQKNPLDLPLASHRETRIAELQKEMQKLKEAQAHRRLWPELYLTAGGSYGSNEYLGTGTKIEDKDILSWNAVVGIKYNFLDWGTRSRQAEAEAQRTAIQSNETDSRLQALRQELSRLSLDFRQLSQNFRLGTELLSLEKKNLELITNEYRQGKVQYLDYITSLKDFANARIGYYTSLFDLKKGILAQKYHQGTIYDAILEQE